MLSREHFLPSPLRSLSYCDCYDSWQGSLQKSQNLPITFHWGVRGLLHRYLPSSPFISANGFDISDFVDEHFARTLLDFNWLNSVLRVLEQNSPCWPQPSAGQSISKSEMSEWNNIKTSMSFDQGLWSNTRRLFMFAACSPKIFEKVPSTNVHTSPV